MTVDKERILVTGGSGFVGASLVRSLLAEGHEVHLILRAASNTWRLREVEDRCRVHWADLRDEQAVRQTVAASRPEVVYHLATHGAYPTQNDRAAILATNLLGTANLLSALAAYDYRAFVNAGSSSEYGHKPGPIRESDRLEPRTDYAVAKAAATLLCQAEAYKGRPVTTVRIFSAYGPWEDSARLASYVMGCCLRGETPKVTTGKQPRDFIYVQDVLTLLKRAAHHSGVRGQVLHAGTGRRQRVRDMVETVLSVCGGGRLAAQFGAEPPRSGEPVSWVANIEQTTALTGWEPRYDLRAGVEQTWEWFRTSGSSLAA
jgi:nucleoside-diphosphate-sugar epimerase